MYTGWLDGLDILAHTVSAGIKEKQEHMSTNNQCEQPDSSYELLIKRKLVSKGLSVHTLYLSSKCNIEMLN